MSESDPASARLIDPALDQQKKLQQLAFQAISRALSLEESKGDVGETLRHYREGVTYLKSGIAIEIFGRGDEYDRARRLRIKMERNLEMALERIQVLETLHHLNSLTLVEDSGSEASNRITSRVPGSSRPSLSSLSRPTTKQVSKVAPRLRPVSTDSGGNGSRPSNLPNGPPQRGAVARARPRSANGCAGPSPTSPVPPISAQISLLRGIDSKLGNVICNEIVDEKPGVKFSDIGGQKVAKDALHEMIILPSLRPELFTGLRSPARGLLLFGPPGNGKTMLAKAVATEARARFFNISASSLTSKWFGEAEKLVRTLFAIARHVQPSIIFLDEVDALLSCRGGTGEHEAMRRLKTEFLSQFDGVQSSADARVIIMGATNRPQEIDDAALRRFPKRIYLGLPDATTRLLILKLLLSKEPHGLDGLSEADLNEIARATDGYSGSDLTVLAKDAAMGPIRELTPNQITKIDSAKIRRVTLQDFRKSKEKVRPSASTALIKEMEKWRDQFGDISC